MEKFNLTVRVHELKLGQVFWFSGGWRVVVGISQVHIIYQSWDEKDEMKMGAPNTLMAGSQILVQLKETNNGKH